MSGVILEPVIGAITLSTSDRHWRVLEFLEAKKHLFGRCMFSRTLIGRILKLLVVFRRLTFVSSELSANSFDESASSPDRVRAQLV